MSALNLESGPRKRACPSNARLGLGPDILTLLGRIVCWMRTRMLSFSWLTREIVLIGMGSARPLARSQDMGDTLSSTHRLHFLTGVLGQAIAGWTKAPRIGAVHFSNQMRTEVNSINTGLRKFESNGLSNKGPTDKAQSSLPFDRAARAHLTQQIGLRILPGQQSLGISS